MEVFKSYFSRWVCVVVTVVMTGILSNQTLLARGKTETFTKQERLFLIQNYGNQGFNPRFLEKVFFDSKLKKIPLATHKNIYNKETKRTKRSYADFTKSYSLGLAHRFSKRWRTLLKRASNKFNVDQEVLVAILLVETGLGNYTGKYPVISVFSSILVSNYSENKKPDLNTILSPEEEYRKKRLQKKALWADKELEALLKITLQSKQSPFRLKGSYAGAFGIPQFLPSSYLRWGYDSDKNGSVNLFLMPDAIYSTANYLNAHGWKKGLHLQSNKRVIWKYNNSEIYVDTILTVAKKIRKIRQSKNEKG